MDVYLRDLYEQIIVDIAGKSNLYSSEDEYSRCSDGLHKLIREVKRRDDVIFNFNEEGRLHSRYLGDRYEPAIISQYRNGPSYYYLFDGEIKDCIHPFNIEIRKYKKIITYYSSERIKQELPIYIYEQEKTTVIKKYNGYGTEPLIVGYRHGGDEINIVDCVRQDYTLHDCMEPALQFKFAD